MRADTAQVLVLESAVGAEMISDENGHNLALGKASLAVPVPLAASYGRRQAQVFLQFRTQILIEIIDNTENILTLSLVIIACLFCNVLIFNYRVTKKPSEITNFLMNFYPKLTYILYLYITPVPF